MKTDKRVLAIAVEGANKIPNLLQLYFITPYSSIQYFEEHSVLGDITSYFAELSGIVYPPGKSITTEETVRIAERSTLDEISKVGEIITRALVDNKKYCIIKYSTT